MYEVLNRLTCEFECINTHRHSTIYINFTRVSCAQFVYLPDCLYAARSVEGVGVCSLIEAAYAFIYTNSLVRIHPPICICGYCCTYTCTPINRFVYLRTRIFTHECMYMSTYEYMYMYILTCICFYIHTYIYLYLYL